MMNATQKNIAIPGWNEKNEKVASARFARGTSVESDGIPLEPNDVAFISCGDDHTPSGDSRGE